MTRTTNTAWTLGAIAALAMGWLAIGSVSSASAKTLAPDTWTAFDFDIPAGSTLFADLLGNPTVDSTFTTGPLAQNAYLKVTDGYIPGDIFQLTINGVLQAPTSTPTGSTFHAPQVDGWDFIYDSGEFSTGFYLLLAGSSYTVTGVTLTSAAGGVPGQGAFELVTTPLPATWILLIAGLIGLGLLSYRHRGTAQALAA